MSCSEIAFIGLLVFPLVGPKVKSILVAHLTLDPNFLYSTVRSKTAEDGTMEEGWNKG